MVFVNSIADIVHSTIDMCLGEPNKNIGDAFLLVWKFPPELIIHKENSTMELERNVISKNIADFSLISFLKIIIGINRKPKILKYR